MTKDEALKLALEAFGEIDWSNNSQWQSDRAKVAIATLKEALAQPEQEPVGEIVDAIEGAFKCSFTKMLPVGTKLYTTPPQGIYYIPPQRTWSGLTDEERKDTLQSVNTGFVVDASVVAFAIEAKLKEKNNG